MLIIFQKRHSCHCTRSQLGIGQSLILVSVCRGKTLIECCLTWWITSARGSLARHIVEGVARAVILDEYVGVCRVGQVCQIGRAWAGATLACLGSNGSNASAQFDLAVDHVGLGLHQLVGGGQPAAREGGHRLDPPQRVVGVEQVGVEIVPRHARHQDALVQRTVGVVHGRGSGGIVQE